MDSLRIILLIIGALVVLGIYLWEIYSHSDHKNSSDILDAVDDFPQKPDSESFPLNSKHADGYQDNEDYADLGGLLTKNRDFDMSEKTSGISLKPHEDIVEKDNHEKKDDELPLEMSVKDYEASMIEDDPDLFAATPVYDEIENKKSIQSTDEEISNPDFDELTEEKVEFKQAESGQRDSTEHTPPSNNIDSSEILVLYIKSPGTTSFNGLSISRAADEVDMVYGHMNVFHHFGSGKLHSGQPLFSMANMFEPGSFDLGKMADLRTRGIAMFMCAPALIDANVVFELFLNTSQRIAKLLDGHITTADNQSLNSSQISHLRDKAALLTINE